MPDKPLDALLYESLLNKIIEKLESIDDQIRGLRDDLNVRAKDKRD